jgi:hypothetical protein
MSTVILQAGDIVFTRSPRLLGKLIRVCTRTFGEARTKVNHVGGIVKGGSITHAVIVEALHKVVRRSLWVAYGPPSDDEVCVYRYKHITEEQRKIIVETRESYVGKDYGYLKLVTHFFDWMLLGSYVFRRLTNDDNYPICSWTEEHAYRKAGIDFGKCASPDDIWDYVTEKDKDNWICVYPLRKLR